MEKQFPAPLIIQEKDTFQQFHYDIYRKREKSQPLNMLNLIRYAFHSNPTFEFQPEMEM